MRVLCFLFLAFLAFNPTVEGQITVSSWEIHEGKEGVINFVTKYHGDPNAYSKMNLPNADDAGWKPAPKNAKGQVSISRRSNLKCNQQLDFTYFQTEVFIPKNTNVKKFTVSYDKADDGARIYFFNSKHTKGHFNAKSDLKFNGPAVGDVNLVDEVVKGEVNRVVIVQFDDCGTGNNLQGIHISVNGTEIKATKPSVKDQCGNEYNTVTYGSQVWLEENLQGPECGKCPKLKKVPLGNHPSKNQAVYSYTEPMYAYYTNNKEDKDPHTDKKLGAMFNFAAIKSCDVCPTGFRIPTEEDWKILEKTVGNPVKLKERNPKNDNKAFVYIAGRGDAYGPVKRGSFVEFWTSNSLNYNQATSFALTAKGKVNMNPENKRVFCYVRCIKGEKKAAAPVIPANFKLHAYSTHGNRGGEDDHWMGWQATVEADWAKILTAQDKKGFNHMEIKKVNVEGAAGVIYLQVKNYNAKDSDYYLTVDPKDSNKIKIKKGKSANAKFRIKNPLQKKASSSNYVSFESVAKPNYFIRHSGYKLYLHEATANNLKNKVFIEDASWLFQKL